MLQPGRKFSAGSGYRYGFNGQEKSTEINEALTTAEYWEYDSRIGRRWNSDPKPDISISPYAVFENNPVWNCDPNGDTLSNSQLRDAAKIADAEIMKRINANKGFEINKPSSVIPLSDAIDAYAEKNQLNLGDYRDFMVNVTSYYNWGAGAAMASKSEYLKLHRLINNSGVGDARAIRLTQRYIWHLNVDLLDFLCISANVAAGEAAGAVGTPVGARPKGVQPRMPFVASGSKVLVECEGAMKYIYRGKNGGSPLFQLKGGEYKYTSQTVRGLSLNVDAPLLTNRTGAAYKITEMPAGLRIVQQGKDAGHFEIIPNTSMSEEQFQSLLNNIKYIKE